MSLDQRFFDYLKQRIGLDVASVGPAIIERAVRQRCIALGMADNDRYWQRLAEIGSRRPLRILSLPCSTGEEPYSIAMALFDAGFAAHQFKVDALDVSPLSVQRAQNALYGKNSFRGQPTDFRERYFCVESDGYQLSERVCGQVSFTAGNLLDPILLASHEPYDFVFCRNLLIYFDLKTQQQALDVLKRLTRDDGVLFIGPAEGSLLNRLGMRSIGAPQSFAFCHNHEPLPAARPVLAELKPLARPKAPAPVPTPASRPFAPRAQAPIGQKSASPVDGPGLLLEQIASLANEGKSLEARAVCEQFLQRHDPQAEVFYWLGLLSDVQGQTSEAQGFYRKALYLEPQHSEALAHLAALLASQGDEAGARRLHERAARNGRSTQSERKQ